MCSTNLIVGCLSYSFYAIWFPPTRPTAVMVGFDQEEVAVSEADRVVVLTLVKRGDNEVPVSVRVSTIEGTATGA